jgi:hypothetical protein
MRNGPQLAGYFEKIGAEFGTTGRMTLAMLTLVSSASASSEEDSAENVRKFDRGDGSVEEDTQEVGAGSRFLHPQSDFSRGRQYLRHWNTLQSRWKSLPLHENNFAPVLIFLPASYLVAG